MVLHVGPPNNSFERIQRGVMLFACANNPLPRRAAQLNRSAGGMDGRVNVGSLSPW